MYLFPAEKKERKIAKESIAKIMQSVPEYTVKQFQDQIMYALTSEEMMEFFHKNMFPYRQLMSYYRCAIMEIETKFKVLNEQFSLQYDRNPIETIKSRLKSQESIIEKLRRKRYPFTFQSIEENIKDVAGVRVICSFPADIYLLADCFMAIGYEDIPAFKKTIDAVAPNNTGVFDLLEPIRNEVCTQQEFEKLMGDTYIHKLTYKEKYVAEVEGKKTYFGRLIRC